MDKVVPLLDKLDHLAWIDVLDNQCFIKTVKTWVGDNQLTMNYRRWKDKLQFHLWMKFLLSFTKIQDLDRDTKITVEQFLMVALVSVV